MAGALAEHGVAFDAGYRAQAPGAAWPGRSLEALVAELPLRRRTVQAHRYLFRAGEARHCLHLVHGGFFKTSVGSEDGRERITGFMMRGDVLGLDALDLPVYAGNAIALDASEVWELPVAALREQVPGFDACLTALLAAQIRRDGAWMLTTGSLHAEQRVVAFLLDLTSRLAALGYSARSVVLRMTRAELGNHLALQLETVTRALSRLQARGLISVSRREIRFEDPVGLRAILAS